MTTGEPVDPMWATFRRAHPEALLAAALGLLAALVAGCAAPFGIEKTTSLEDVKKSANEMMDVGYKDVPVVAADLGATVISGGPKWSTSGRMLGTDSVEVDMSLEIQLEGPAVPTERLVATLETAGYTDITTDLVREDPILVAATGTAPDGDYTMSIHSGVMQAFSDSPYTGLEVFIIREDSPRISEADRNKFTLSDIELDVRRLNEAIEELS